VQSAQDGKQGSKKRVAEYKRERVMNRWLIGTFLLLATAAGISSHPQPLPEYFADQAVDSDYLDSIDNGPLEVLPGCSWYCGGFVSGKRASSELHAQAGNSYKAENAHDFDIATAWVEGAKGNGIGEYLEYSFDTRGKGEHSLGITTVILANGYKKSASIWKKNGRVKTFKVSRDGQPYAILHLLDSFEFQTVEIGKIMLPQEGLLTLRFQILDVYPGTQYQDVAISELLFDGVGVH
jgi:hypothetical protein